MPTKLTHEIIAAAILGFEEQKRHIDSQISELRAMLDGAPNSPAATSEPPKHKRRKMSVAARKRIAAAQRKRWAESKKQSESAQQGAKQEAAKPKRKLSAAGRRAIIAATKKRWAAVRAARAN
jgi:hypothetical protein